MITQFSLKNYKQKTNKFDFCFLGVNRLSPPMFLSLGPLIHWLSLGHYIGCFCNFNSNSTKS